MQALPVTGIKRTREQALIDVDDAGAGAPRKVATRTWDEYMDDLRSAIKLTSKSLPQQKRDISKALRALGACAAAAQRATHVFMDVHKLRIWANDRHRHTRAMLRMWEQTKCPEKTCKKGERCTWRVTAAELDPVDVSRFVARDEKAAADTFFPLALLPTEIIGHVARLLAPDFGTLRVLGTVCRMLRRIVAAMLPSILVDCTIFVRAPVPFLEWHAELPSTDDMARMPSTSTNGNVYFRTIPCNAAASRMLARPGRTIYLLSRHSNSEWRNWIARRAWGDAYDTYTAAEKSLLSPFASEREMTEVRALTLEARELQRQWGHGKIVRFNCESIHNLRLCIARARELALMTKSVQKTLADVEQREPMLSMAYSRADIMDYIMEAWVSSDAAHASMSAETVANLVDTAVKVEVDAYLSTLAEHNISLAYLGLTGLLYSNRLYLSSTPGEICEEARDAIIKIYNKQHPLYTTLPYWFELHAELVLVQFPVERIFAHTNGGCVARMLLVQFAKIADSIRIDVGGFSRCPERLHAVWEPIERAILASYTPCMAK